MTAISEATIQRRSAVAVAAVDAANLPPPQSIEDPAWLLEQRAYVIDQGLNYRARVVNQCD